MLFVIGMVDLSALSWEYMQVNAAANAGAQWVINQMTVNGSVTYNSTSISSAVTNATPLTVTAQVSEVKACITGGVITTVSGSTCSSGGPPGEYAEITATANISPLVSWATIVIPSTLTAYAVARVS